LVFDILDENGEMPAPILPEKGSDKLEKCWDHLQRFFRKNKLKIKNK